jgi:hypothetical protein
LLRNKAHCRGNAIQYPRHRGFYFESDRFHGAQVPSALPARSSMKSCGARIDDKD